jgi:large subunit ribosomal protein L6
MSRIGRLPIEIPAGVNVTLEDGACKVVGPKGELTYKFNKNISVEMAENKINISIKKETKKTAGLYGLTRTLISNMIKGVSEGFDKQLEFNGVGYRANVEGRDLVMHLGYSHPIRYTPREGVDIKVEKNLITVSGISKQLVGQTAAEIREFRKPEPYKGKGIKYITERIRRKAGKAAAKGA